MNVLKLSLVFTLLFSFVIKGDTNQEIDQISFYTEIYPPYQYQENKKTSGLIVDTLEEMLKRVGSKKSRNDFEIVPWARGMKLILNKEKSSLFSMTRTPERENLFKWVGPVAQVNQVIISLKSRKIKINSIEDLNKKFTIGVIREDIGEELVRDTIKDKSYIKIFNTPEKLVRVIDKQRLDLWVYGDLVWQHVLRNLKKDPKNYEVVYKLREGETYYAFHKNTPDKIIEKLQITLDQMKQDGALKKIMDKYK